MTVPTLPSQVQDRSVFNINTSIVHAGCNLSTALLHAIALAHNSILSFLEGINTPLLPAPPAPAVPVPAAAAAAAPTQRRSSVAIDPPVQQPSPFFTPADLFVLQADNSAGPGAIVRDRLLGRDTAAAASAAARHLRSEGHLRPAGMGAGATQWQDDSSRGDHILWLTGGIAGQPDGAWPGLEAALRKLTALGAELRANCPALQLSARASVQLAWYPGDGAGYVRHLDAGSSSSSGGVRRVTALYYLNPDWCERDGGWLRLFLTGCSTISCRRDGANVWDIEPLLDRLVLFRSDLVEHQVSYCDHCLVCVTRCTAMLHY
jgi:SM-20-related protein